jgi:hypothetical protein
MADRNISDSSGGPCATASRWHSQDASVSALDQQIPYRVDVPAPNVIFCQFEVSPRSDDSDEEGADCRKEPRGYPTQHNESL